VINIAALQMVLGVLTGWLERREREAIDYLVEENRLLRRQLGRRRIRLGSRGRPSDKWSSRARRTGHCRV